MEFVLQGFIGSHHHEPIRPFLEHIKKLSGPNLAVIERTLGEADYHALLLSADVVLVPYERPHYVSRTSGVFVEAIANGKPVVVTGRTWMSRQLGDSGAGIVFDDSDPKNLADAIAEAARRLPELREKTEKFRAEYGRFHNPGAFLRALMRL